MFSSHIDHPAKQTHLINELNPIILDPIFFGPQEISFKILSYLNPIELGKSLQVNRKWQRLVDDENVWKELPFPPIAFGKQQWKEYGINVEEVPLPKDIHQIIERACPIWQGKKIKETHWLIFIPKTVNEIPFTLNYLIKFIQSPKENKESTIHSLPEILKQYGNIPIIQSYWILITKNTIPETPDRNYKNQKNLINLIKDSENKTLYRVASLVENLIALFIKNSSFQMQGFPCSSLSTYCLESMPINKKDLQYQQISIVELIPNTVVMTGKDEGRYGIGSTAVRRIF